MKKSTRMSCAEYIAARVAAARDKQVVDLFNDLERQALIDRLNTDAAQRERDRGEAMKQGAKL